MEHFSTIKGTANNKQRARIWVESAKLVNYGFARHTPVTVYWHSDRIVVEADADGERKVAGRERNGRSISILDLCCDQSQRAAMFKGADKLDVFAEPGKLVIKAAQ